ncbi:hypothetical protein GF319_03875 [Candidatus Bathyarchaeota archaeon]|nr:hypothetical protein [Candidatus Bathyarchaeota archaeon]
MGFLCPECKNKELEITSSIEIPPDTRSDEITLQVLRCTRCGFKSLGLYEESRRGNLREEYVNHKGIYIPEAELKDIELMIKKCPDPRNSKCICDSHRYFSVKAKGRWKCIERLIYYNTFVLEF